MLDQHIKEIVYKELFPYLLKPIDLNILKTYTLNVHPSQFLSKGLNIFLFNMDVPYRVN
jgi:hypothetical protein